MNIFPSSLVKYSNPFQISIGKVDKNDKHIDNFNFTDFYVVKSSKVDNRVKILEWIEDMEKDSTIEEILNTVIVPRQLSLLDKGQVWIQTCLSVPATKSEVLQLEEELIKRLKQRQANDTGICPIREELYSQVFDEIIRQVIINYKKRGLLLSCIRDQIYSTIDSYKNLYESSIAFGIRKTIKSTDSKTKLISEISELEKDCDALHSEVKELEGSIEKLKESQILNTEKKRNEHLEELEKYITEKKEISQNIEYYLLGNSK